MSGSHRYTVHLRPEPEGGFTVLVPAIPEIVSYGETHEEAMAMAREAIELMLDVYRDDGKDPPEDVPVLTEHLTIAA
ncbi:MAG: type II toxin-antitoxin system HicB family antitoxin [Pseudomonadota bacterium]